MQIVTPSKLLPTMLSHLAKYLTLVMICGLVSHSLARISHAADGKPDPAIYKTLSEGSEQAKLVLDEYFSLTCPHCAKFATEVLPQIKKNYIDTGKVRLIYHDYPLDARAMAMAQLARCANPQGYSQFIATLFAQQSKWATAQDFMPEVYRYGGFAGMKKIEVDQCFANKDLYQAILQVQTYASDKLEVQGTPTFFLNGKKLDYNELSYAEFSKHLDKALAK